MESALKGTTLLVGIDFSAGCEQALLCAVELAEQIQARLELAHVYEWEAPSDRSFSSAGTDSAKTGTASSRLVDEVESLAGAARWHLAQLCSDLVGDRVPAEIQVLIGDAPEGLRRAAQRTAASLIVLGTQGRHEREHATMGSTAVRLCASSFIPVVLVPRSEVRGVGAQRASALSEARLVGGSFGKESALCGSRPFLARYTKDCVRLRSVPLDSPVASVRTRSASTA